MPQKHVIIDSVVLVIAALTAFILYRFAGTSYDIEIVAALFILYIISRRFLPVEYISFGTTSRQLFDAGIFTILVLQVILTTGGLSSHLFFLIYFLIFALGLLLEPVVSLTTALAIGLMFLADLSAGFSPQELIPLAALPLFVPFALLLGREYRKALYQRRRFLLEKKKEQTVEEDALMFTSLIVRSHITKIEDLARNFRGDHDLDEIKKTARRLQKLIDKFEREY